MTEFTKDDIEYYRKQYALWTSRKQTTPEELHLIGRLRDALDHIEQLQKRVEKVEDNREHIERLQARIAELEQERRWIPVTIDGDYPEEGQRILTIDMDDNIEVMKYFGQFYDLITYWKPIEPPENYISYKNTLPQQPKESEE